MALGTYRGQLIRMVVGEGMAVCLAGLAVGMLSALALTRFLSSLLIGMGSTVPATFAAVARVGILEPGWPTC